MTETPKTSGIAARIAALQQAHRGEKFPVGSKSTTSTYHSARSSNNQSAIGEKIEHLQTTVQGSNMPKTSMPSRSAGSRSKLNTSLLANLKGLDATALGGGARPRMVKAPGSTDVIRGLRVEKNDASHLDSPTLVSGDGIYFHHENSARPTIVGINRGKRRFPPIRKIKFSTEH